MKYRKTIILLILTIFLFSITSVCANEIDTQIVHDDAIALSANDEIIEDNLQTNENTELSIEDNDKSVQNDNDMLGDDASATYSDLAGEISQTGNITLTYKNYIYNQGAAAIIINEDNKIIDGNGAVIDMEGSIIRAFTVDAPGVTIKNLTIKNANYNSDGGAVYFNKDGMIINCNFINGSASKAGGAIYFNDTGTVTNCNFTNNKALNSGGAIYFKNDGEVINCNFTNNKATNSGGAIYFKNDGEVTNCNFINSSAQYSGAIDFESSGTVMNCDFIGNNATIDGGAIYFSSPDSTQEVVNCNFVNNKADGREDGEGGGAIYFTDTGTVINCNFIENFAYEEGGAIWMYSIGTVANCNFTDNSADYGGAISFKNTGSLTNCNFINNTATTWGGAVYSNIYGEVTNSNFTDNSAEYGGAIYIRHTCNVTNCNFAKNSASEDGGAIMTYSGTATNCNFADNSANRGGAIMCQEWGAVTADTCIFKTNSDTVFNTLNFPPTLNVDNFTAFYNYSVKLTFDLRTNSNMPVTNRNISISVYYKENNSWVGNYSCLSGEGWTVDLPIGLYYAIFDTEYAEFQPINRTITIISPKHIFWELNHIINSNDDPVINLNNDYYFDSDYDTDFVNGIAINRQVTINGNGHTINANGKARIFQITGNDVVLENITIVNGYYFTSGGAVYFKNNGEVTNCNFTGNNAGSYGGAVYFESNGAVINSNFTNNAATWGGAIGFKGKGTVTNCNFADNTAQYSGAIDFEDTGTLTNCNFINNSASEDGGAVYITDNGEVTNCNFINNSANYGGAIDFEETSTLTNCNFINNSASEDGGAIFSRQWYSSADTCIFKTDSDTILNTVILSPTLNVDNFTTFYNSGEKLTFDLKTNSNMSVTNGNISIRVYFKNNNSWIGNYSCLSGEGWIPDLPVGSYYAIFDTEYAEFQPINRTITVISSKYTFVDLDYTINSNDNPVINLNNNYYFDSDYDADFVNGIAINRQVTINGNGHTINANGKARIFYVTGSNVVLENITLVNGYNSSKGGAIYFSENGEVTNCNFINNSASENAAAIFFNANGNVANCNFINNSASVDGGAIDFESIGSVTNCNFTNNSASETGGAVYFYKNGEVRNCNFINNTAIYGGAIIFDSTSTLTNCNFINNTASQRGGAVYFNKNSEVENCNFSNNRAYIFGGAISINSGSMTNCNFIKNTAKSGGAVLFLFDVAVSNCNFTNNSAQNGGAVTFYNDGTMTNCNYVNNTASNGGAILFENTGTVTNCNFTNNKATDRDDYNGGGAIYFKNIGTVTNCNFTNNSANNWGGAVYFYWNGTVTNCNFTNNSANNWGGAVYFDWNSTVTNCNFIDNSASNNGGAIFFLSEGEVTNCNFTNNKASYGSAIYFDKYYSTDRLTIYNSSFLNNRANAETLEVTINENNITITFTGNDNLLNAIYSNGDVSFTNVTYWGANGIANTGSSPITPSKSNREGGQKITIVGVVNGNIINTTKITDDEGRIILENISDYYLIVRHDTDSYYTEAETINTNMKFYANVTSQTTNNKTVNITAKSNILSEIMDGKLLFILPNGEKVTANYAGNETWWVIHTFDEYANYEVNAKYDGLDNVTINSATISITKANSTLIIDNVILDYDDTINVTATTKGATGITAKIDGDTVTVNEFTIPISDLNAGNHTLTVTTIPDEDHTSVTKTVNITVNKINSTITLDNIELDYGEIKNITINTEGASGITAMIDDEEARVNEFTIMISSLDAGKHTLTVTTNPDENHNPVTKTANITVNKVNSTITLDNIELDYGETKNITVTTEGAKGITAKIDDNETSVNEFTIQITNLKLGNHTLTVTTIPDENHNPATKTVNVTVNKAKPQIIVDSITTTYNTNKDLVITIKSYNGEPLSGVNVTVDLNGVENYTTDENGEVKVPTLGLTPETYIATITFNGNENYTEYSTTANVTVEKANATLTAENTAYIINYGGKYTVTIKDSNGNSVSNGKVTFILNGKNIGSATVNTHGVATITLTAKILKTAKAGTKNLKITFNNDYYNTLSKTVNVKINKEKTKIKAKKKTFKKAKKVKKYKITLKNSKGKAVKKVKVTLKIKGKKFKAKTNKKGKAVFKIKKLTKKGKYKAKIKFKANKYYLKASKKVKIKIK